MDEQAAHLTLLALRGMIPAYESIDEDHVRFSPDRSLHSTDAAARLLMAMPKPLACYAESVDGVLEVRYKSLANASTPEHDRFVRRRQFDEEHGGLFPDLVERYGGDEHVIAVFARGKSMFVPLEVARRWNRDYELSFSNWRADDANNRLAKEDPDYIEARRRGAKGVLRFDSSAGRVPTMDGGDLQFPPPASASPDDRQILERAFVEIAKSLMVEIIDERELAAEERELVERGELSPDALVRHNRDWHWHGLRLFASQMRYFFAGSTPPADVAAFIRATRSPSSGDEIA